MPGHYANMRLSVVVPAYNEACRVASAVELLRDWVLDSSSDEILVVDDGSSDSTAKVAGKALHGFPGQVVEVPHRGKGAAIKAGLLASKGDYVAWLDADLEYPPQSLIPMLRKAERLQGACVYRRRPDLRPLEEVATSKAAAAMIRSALSISCSHDPQAGLKVFEGTFGREVAATVLSDGWLFDAEVLARAERNGLRVCEQSGPQIPARRRSAGLKEMVGLLRELALIKAAVERSA